MQEIKPNMKKAKEYIKEYRFNNFFLKEEFYPEQIREEIEKVIKQAQEEAIIETVKKCAESAEANHIYPYNRNEPYVVKSSILSVAEKLIKEL